MAALESLAQTPENVHSSYKRILFVGNSHTYQPKELGGIPGVVSRLASAISGTEVLCESVVKGGADLVELWDEFEIALRRTPTSIWDTVVLQVGSVRSPEAQFTTTEVLRHRYAPLLLDLQPTCKVLLYQTWSGPQPDANESELLIQGAQACCTSLLTAGIRDVRVAHAAHSFLAVRDLASDNRRIYAALWKDDMGHGSALAGALVGALILQILDLATASRRPLERTLYSILPQAWRTASPGFAGELDVGQRWWGEGARGAPAELMELAGAEEDRPLSKYPPGLRTERRSLGVSLGEVLVAAAKDASSVSTISNPQTHIAIVGVSPRHPACDGDEDLALAPGAQESAVAEPRARRWSAAPAAPAPTPAAPKALRWRK